mgnify:CR=1 FL=1
MVAKWKQQMQQAQHEAISLEIGTLEPTQTQIMFRMMRVQTIAFRMKATDH